MKNDRISVLLKGQKKKKRTKKMCSICRDKITFKFLIFDPTSNNLWSKSYKVKKSDLQNLGFIWISQEMRERIC